jgi:pimeloyl-ACP methyl ester carboxylesterase
MLGAMGSSNPLDTARYSGGALARDFLALVDSLSLRDDALVGYSMGADWSVLMACGTLWLQAALARTTAAGRGVVVRLSDGTLLPAEVVVVGVGVTPCTELAEAAGLATEDQATERCRSTAWCPMVSKKCDLPVLDGPATTRPAHRLEVARTTWPSTWASSWRWRSRVSAKHLAACSRRAISASEATARIFRSRVSWASWSKGLVASMMRGRCCEPEDVAVAVPQTGIVFFRSMLTRSGRRDGSPLQGPPRSVATAL